MNIALDRNSSSGLTKQISDQIRDLIRSGQLKPGEKIPSTRILSKDLNVNRITVAQAYKTLINEGFVRAGVGSGTFVSYHAMDSSNILDRSIYAPKFSIGMQSLWHAHQDTALFMDIPEGAVNFAALVPDERLFPVEDFKKCLDRAMDEEGYKLLQYGGTLGYQPLREYIAGRLKKRGIQADANQVLVVNGAQQGIDLVLRCFLSPGDQVAVSFPTYHNIFPVVEHLRAGVAPVTMTDQGPDLESLRQTVASGTVRLIYTMPNFQNPTGVTCDRARRQGIYEIASEADLPVLEDDFEMDLSFQSQEDNVPAIKTLDRDGRILFLSTFSKSLFPGLRIGWLLASPRTLDALAALKKATDLESSALLQAAAHRFCVGGYYEKHLKRIRALIRERMEAALESLEKHMPEGVTWSRPKGGYALWIRLTPGLSSEKIFTLSKNAGVLVSPGTMFGHRGKDPGGIRLSLTRTDVPEIQEGIRILGDVIKEGMRLDWKRDATAPQPQQHL